MQKCCFVINDKIASFQKLMTQEAEKFVLFDFLKIPGSLKYVVLEPYLSAN